MNWFGITTAPLNAGVYNDSVLDTNGSMNDAGGVGSTPYGPPIMNSIGGIGSAPYGPPDVTSPLYGPMLPSVTNPKSSPLINPNISLPSMSGSGGQIVAVGVLGVLLLLILKR